MSSTVELLLHPVRLRIVQAFLGRPDLTTAALRDQLPDVPAASLYRQVAMLVDAGVLAVVAERRVRGAVERTYALDLAADHAGYFQNALWLTDAEHARLQRRLGEAFAPFVANKPSPRRSRRLISFITMPAGRGR
jgi:hypothetical protein